MPLEDTLSGIVAMANMQERADSMLEDVKMKEAHLIKLGQEVDKARSDMKNTQRGTNKLTLDMITLQKELKDLQHKEMVLGKTNKKLGLVEER